MPPRKGSDVVKHSQKHVPVDPGDIDILGLHWHDYYIEKTWYSVLNRVLKSLRDCQIALDFRFIMTQEGHYMLDYIDDNLIFGHRTQCQRDFDRLNNLLEELALTISIQNITPRQQVVCLGVLVDAKNVTVSVPLDKLREIQKLLKEWARKKICHKREFQTFFAVYCVLNVSDMLDFP